MTDIKMFYPNMLKIYDECPKKFKYKYIDKIEFPTPQKFFEKGKKIHALANYYLKGQDITKLNEALTYDEKEIFKLLINNKYFNKTYVNSEYNLSAKINNFWISGRFDALMQDKEYFYILDYKTGSIPKNPEYDFQTILYLLILNEYLKSKQINKKIKFIYIDLKNTMDKEIDFNDKTEKAYTDTVTKTCQNITKDTSFTQKSNNKCAFCEYSKFCKF